MNNKNEKIYKSKEMARDSVCGMMVDKYKAINKKFGDRTYYFCSENCLRVYEAPEEELKKMKKRVGLALLGVVTVASLRVIAMLGLVAAIMVIEIGGISVWELAFFIISTPIIWISGWSIHKSAFKAIKSRAINMDVLISIGVLAGWLYGTASTFFPKIAPMGRGYFEIAIAILAFVLLGKYIEEIIRRKSAAAVRKLLELKPTVARVLRNGKEIEIPIDEVKVGDAFLVKPGEKIPTDGIIIEGYSAIDEKIITGESIPVEKKVGDEVIGATINKSGLLKVRATKVGEETALAQIAKLVEEAQASTANVQRFADKVVSYFVPAVILIGISAFVFWFLVIGSFPFAFLILLSVLLIACPCSLGIATPAALLAGIGKGAEYGILLRGGEYVEKSEKLQTIVFDKTGTLTKGEIEVIDIVTFENYDKNEVLMLTALVEKGSEHPIGQAIVKTAEKRKIMIPEGHFYETIAGKGIKAKYLKNWIFVGSRKLMKENGIEIENLEKDMEKLENEGKTVFIVAMAPIRNEISNGASKKAIGIIAVADTLKDFAKETIEELNKMGKETVILTGDNERVGKAIARQLGIKDVLAEVLPQDKAKIIKRLQEKGKVVAMVGDGVNDAPALAQADIGIAIGSGTDIAKEAGGIVLIKDDLRDVVKAIRLSKATMKKIKQNLFWAFIYNVIAIPVAAGLLYPFFGILLSPIIAAAAMAISSLFVVGNSALLKFAKI